MNIEIIQEKKSDNHNDSFWYSGLIAKVVKPNGTILHLYAEGEIRINGQHGLVHDGSKERNEGVDGGLNNDEDLGKISNYYDDKYYWENNNWFEVYYKGKDDKFFDSPLGDVAHEYNDAIKLLKCYYDSDEF